MAKLKKGAAKPVKPRMCADYNANEQAMRKLAQKRYKNGRKAWVQTKTVNKLIKQLDSLKGRIAKVYSNMTEYCEKEGYIKKSNKLKGRYAKYAR